MGNLRSVHSLFLLLAVLPVLAVLFSMIFSVAGDTQTAQAVELLEGQGATIVWADGEDIVFANRELTAGLGICGRLARTTVL